jgi:nitrous oxidase accessory protein NosD
MRTNGKWMAVCALVALVTLGSACGTPPAQPKPGRYVSATGTDVGDCALPSKACATINYAVSQATNGQTVFVGAGTYEELVVVDRPLRFSGPNAGRKVGTSPAARVPEATVKGFRSPGVPHPTSSYNFDVTIDGFRVDPQGDTALLTPNTFNLISLFGGNDVKVVNNIIRGGEYVPGCSYTCTTMADSAVWISSGTYVVADNLVENFRRPLDIVQASGATPIVSATYRNNRVQDFTFRGFWALEMGSAFPADSVRILDNEINGMTGTLDTSAPTGALVTAGGVTISGNTFKNLDTGVYEWYCASTNPTDIPTEYSGNVFDEVSLGLQLHLVGDCTGRSPSAEVKDNSFVGGLWDANSTVTTGVTWWGGTPPLPTLDATCNFWGSADGPGVGTNALAGSGVTTSPWQSAPGAPC